MTGISLLTAVDSVSHIHLIVGSNPLAAARCAKSLEVGAKPRLIAPETAELHYALQKKVDSGEVDWLKKAFDDEDILRLGREAVNGVVDTVFVTLGPRDPLSELNVDLRCTELTSARCTHISALQAESNTSQRCRRSLPLHILPPFHSHRRSSADRSHNQWPRLQTFLSNTARNRILPPSTTRPSLRTPRNNPQADTRRGPSLTHDPRR